MHELAGGVVRARVTSDGQVAVSLSDVPSYFSTHQGRVYLQRLSSGLAPGALVVVRCYLRVPEATDTAGYRDVTERNAELVSAEKTQIYSTFIYEYQG